MWHSSLYCIWGLLLFYIHIIGIKYTAIRLWIIKHWINILKTCPLSPSASIYISFFLSEYYTLLSSHVFVYSKTPASFFPFLVLGVSNRPPSFLPTFSLHDLCPTLTFTPFLWLFSGCLSFSLWFFSRQCRIQNNCCVFLFFCFFFFLFFFLWDNGSEKDGKRMRGEKRRKNRFLFFIPLAQRSGV